MARSFSMVLTASVMAWAIPAVAVKAQEPSWHLERVEPGMKMTAHLERRVVSAGALIDSVAATPAPVTLPWQNHITIQMTIDGRAAGAKVTEGSIHKRRVTVTQVDQKHAFTIGTDITANVYRYRVAQGPPKVAARDLSREEQAASLASMGNLDYQTTAFQAYIAKNDLTWRRDSGESLDAFIKRAALLIKKDFAYFDGDQDRHLSALASSCRGDCGAINGVFVGVMRQNKIPAQLWAGFRRLPAMPDAWQPHVVASVFIPKIGWLPVDLVSGDQVIFSMTGANNAIFVTHIDDGFVLNLPGWLTLRPDWMQPTAFYYRGGKITSGLDCSANIRFSKLASP